MSTGNGVIPQHDGDGVPNVGGSNSNWMSLALTTKSGDGFNSAAKIKAYYFDGSVGIAPTLVGNVALEMGPAHMGYPSNTAQDIDAMDFGLGVMTFGLTSVSDQFITVTDKFYFSVTKTWADQHGANFYTADGNSPTIGDADAGDIYVMTWTPDSTSSGGSWNLPQIYISRADLETGLPLPGNGATFDVDMIAIDAGNGTAIFSTTHDIEMPSELMVYQDPVQGGTPYSSRPLRVSATETVADRAGLGNNGDVNGGCATDPELGGTVPLSRLVGYASQYGPGGDVPMGLSISRAITEGPIGLSPGGGGGASPHDYFIQATGWGAASSAIDTDTFVGFYMRPGPLTSDPGPPTLPSGGNGWVLMSLLPRVEHQETVSLMIPEVAPTTGTAGLSILSVMYHGTTYQPIAYSWVAEIEL